VPDPSHHNVPKSADQLVFGNVVALRDASGIDSDAFLPSNRQNVNKLPHVVFHRRRPDRRRVTRGRSPISVHRAVQTAALSAATHSRAAADVLIGLTTTPTLSSFATAKSSKRISTSTVPAKSTQ